MQMLMKAVVGSMLVLSASLSVADTLTVDAAVKDVTLYTNQADILRRTTLALPSDGQHELRITGLLSDTIEDIGIDVQGANLLNQSLVAGSELTALKHSDELHDAQRKLQVIERELQDNVRLATALSNRLETAESDINDVQDRIANLREHYAQLLRQKAQIEDNINRLNKLIEWQGDEQSLHLNKTLVLTISGEQATNVQVSLRERSHNAYWQPMSQWHLDTQSKQLDIVGQAKISQMTGIDWHDTNITLAVMPMQYYYKPEFIENTVSYLPNNSKQGLAADSYQLAVVEDSYAQADMTNMRKSHAQPQPVIIESGGNFQVKMPHKVTLASGRDSHLLTYYREQVQVDEIFSAFYSWDWSQQALLIASWKQPGKMPLLAGSMKLYRDGLFLADRGNSILVQPGSAWEMSFGVDARLEVETISPPEYKENNGFINRDRLVKTQQTLQVTNHGDKSLPVRIYARLPVATEESIKIKPTWSPKPDVSDVDGVKGIVYWAKELPAKETLSVNHGYEIRYPEDKTIITN